MFRLIEDSDGDPNHTDGLFILAMLGALWCFREGSNCILKCIYEGKDLREEAIVCYGAAATILGVRITWSAVRNKFKDKISPEEENKPTP